MIFCDASRRCPPPRPATGEVVQVSRCRGAGTGRSLMVSKGAILVLSAVAAFIVLSWLRPVQQQPVHIGLSDHTTPGPRLDSGFRPVELGGDDPLTNSDDQLYFRRHPGVKQALRRAIRDAMTAAEYDVSKVMTTINVLLGSSVIGGALGFFMESVTNSQERWFEEEQAACKLDNILKDATPAMRRWIKFKQGVKNNQTPVVLGVIISIFLMMGIVYGMVKAQWTFWTSLYFAVTSMSTAGLQGIGDPEDPESTIFTGLYALIGVPLYGLALGQGASLLVQARVKRLAREQFNQVIGLEEFLLGIRDAVNRLVEEGGEVLELG